MNWDRRRQKAKQKAKTRGEKNTHKHLNLAIVLSDNAQLLFKLTKLPKRCRIKAKKCNPSQTTTTTTTKKNYFDFIHLTFEKNEKKKKCNNFVRISHFVTFVFFVQSEYVAIFTFACAQTHTHRKNRCHYSWNITKLTQTNGIITPKLKVYMFCWRFFFFSSLVHVRSVNAAYCYSCFHRNCYDNFIELVILAEGFFFIRCSSSREKTGTLKSAAHSLSYQWARERERVKSESARDRSLACH